MHVTSPPPLCYRHACGSLTKLALFSTLSAPKSQICVCFKTEFQHFDTTHLKKKMRHASQTFHQSETVFDTLAS